MIFDQNTKVQIPIVFLSLFPPGKTQLGPKESLGDAGLCSNKSAGNRDLGREETLARFD